MFNSEMKQLRAEFAFLGDEWFQLTVICLWSTFTAEFKKLGMFEKFERNEQVIPWHSFSLGGVEYKKTF